MPVWSNPGITTPAHSIGNFQDGCDKLATGLKNNILTTHITTQRTTMTIIKRRIKLPTNITTIGTWNVHTLNRVKQMHELMVEL